MPLIDGIGDEVVQFAVAILVTVVAALAWWSTNARPDRYRTVLVMRSRANLPITFSIRTRSNLMISNMQTNAAQASTPDSATTRAPESPVESLREAARVIPIQEMDSIVDADMAMLDNHRLHFYRRVDSPGNVQNASESSAEEVESQEESEPASDAQIREMDSIVSAMEADVTTGCDVFTRAGEPNATVTAKQTQKVDNKAENPAATDNLNIDSNVVTSGETGDANAKILIRLKYLNDTLKEVEGSLDELLKDFKWRHFSTELAAESRVRLIFNGHVLSDERATLRACGLHDRAVVHCLVHPKRAPAQQHGLPEEGAIAAGNEVLSEGNPRERPWDLENILLTLVSVALTVVWFFRCEYSNMFTASASVALFGLTVFYSIAIFGLYLSDTFHFDRRPAQPVPDN